MRAPLIVCITAALLTAGCRDSNGPEKTPPLTVTTDSATYTRPAGSITSVEVGFRNNSSSTIWIASCGTGISSRPGTSPVLRVYGLELISYATTPPTVGDVAALCDTAPAPYAIAPGMGVRADVLMTRSGRFAFSLPFSNDASGSYDQRTGSPDFVIIDGA
jgi:hypothetical protein